MTHRIRLTGLALLALLGGLALPARAQLLYRATHADGRTVYLLGSVHLLPREEATLGPAVEAAYRAADALAFELSPEAMAAAAPLVLQRGLLPADSTLLQGLPDSLRTALSAEVAGPFGGMLMRARPWLAALLVGQATLAGAGYDAGSGVEGQLFARARTDARPFHAFETVEDQIRLFADAPRAAQVHDLATALAQRADAPAHLARLVALWRAGDADGLATLLDAEFADAPDQRERLLDARNRAWMPRLTALAAETPTLLVVVGAGHLVGPGGLAALLDAQGWHVTHLPPEGP